MRFRPAPAIRTLPEELPVPSEFRDPPPGHGPMPVWLWNARLDDAEVRRQVRELRDQGCSGAFLRVHPRCEPSYLSAEWLRLVRAAAEEAAPLGFQLWPVLTAADSLPDPACPARVLHLRQHVVEGEPVSLLPEGEFLGAWAAPLDPEGEARADILALTPDAEGRIPLDPGAERWRVALFTVRPAEGPDPLDPEATALLLRQAYDPLAEALSEFLGAGVPGFVSEEPAPSLPPGMDGVALPWSPLLPAAFRERCGYDLREHLPALCFPTDDAARVRVDYYRTVNRLRESAFHQPVRQWCAAHGVQAAGAPVAALPGDTPGFFRHLDIPGVVAATADEGGIVPRLASSLAHQQGRPRVFAEVFGAAGWGTTPAQRKNRADRLIARGANLIAPHAALASAHGWRKRESGPSEFEQEPFWRHYHHFAQYLARLGLLLTRGRHSARVAVLYPQESLWAHTVPGAPSPSEDERARVAFAGCGSSDRLLLARVERDLVDLCDLLDALHFDFDFIDAEGLAAARVQGNRLCLGQEGYELLILPSLTTCDCRTWERVDAFFAAGGNVLSCGVLPFQTGQGSAEDAALRAAVQALTTVDPLLPERPGGSTARALGRDAMQPLRVNREHGSRVARYLPGRVPLPQQRQLLMKTLLRSLVVLDVDVEHSDIVCHQRETADGRIFFLANTAAEPRETRAIFYTLGHPEEWDPTRGEVHRLWEYARSGEKVTLPLRFAPGQTRAIIFTGTEGVRAERANFHVTGITEGEDHYLVEGVARDSDRPLDTPPNASLVWENGGRWAEGPDRGLLEPICLGDLWDLRVLGDNYLILEEWRHHTPRPDQDPALLAQFQAHWPELPARAESPDAVGPEAETWYQTRFLLDSVPRSLSLLLEPLDAPYTVLVNGQEVFPMVTGVLDPQFLTADIADVAMEGENVVALRVAPSGAGAALPERARLLGDFTALPEEDGGYLLYAGAPPQMLSGSWTQHGFPHYSGALEYSQPVLVRADYFDFQLVLVCDDPACVVEALVNGKPAGVCLWPPYAFDVSDLLFTGSNEIVLRVTNTAANALLGETRPSGLLGPVRIEAFARLEVQVPRPIG